MSIKLCGVRFYLGFSFAAVVTLMLLCADAKIALISLFSSAAHETGHLVCLFIFGQKPVSVELGAFGMRIKSENCRALSYIKEAVFTLAGVMVNLVIAGACFLLCHIFPENATYALAVNLIIGGFNLLPFYQLDGGRTIHLLISGKFGDESANKVLKTTSYLTVAFLWSVGIYLYIRRGFNVSIAVVSAYLALMLVKEDLDDKKRD